MKIICGFLKSVINVISLSVKQFSKNIQMYIYDLITNLKEDTEIKFGLWDGYNDLAPIDNVKGNDEYFKTLHWSIKNKKIKNIAITGPYGSGKSSVISTYLKRHPIVKRKYIRVSMAMFSDNSIDSRRAIIKIPPDQLQEGILQQLFYKVNHRKIPQSRYRKLHKVSFWYVFFVLCFIEAAITVFLYIFKNNYFREICNMIVIAGENMQLDKMYSYYIFGILVLVFTLFLASLWRKFYFRVKIKEVKTKNTTFSSNQNTGESVFNKNMDEIVYFFEETKYNVVFFEDFDRLGTSEIFFQLRELNTLLNNCDTIKRKIVFVYAVRDDIFTEEDRTKFFEFIIPIIPVLNSTNSGETMLSLFEVDNKTSVKHDISFDFIMDISPFISDMRMLHNIYNEFLVYKRTLRTVQGLELSDISMLSMIIFKNLHPKDFSDLQMEKGLVKQAFNDKLSFIEAKQIELRKEIDIQLALIEDINKETLENYKELKMAMLGSLVDWEGFVKYICSSPYETNRIRTQDLLNDTFDWKSLLQLKEIYVTYHLWILNREETKVVKNGIDIVKQYYNRFLILEKKVEDRISLIKEKVSKLKQTINDLNTLSLKELMVQENENELFSDVVNENKVLIFMLRQGYIDEKYACYLNYFKGESITTDDMNYILAVKNREPKPFDYVITKTEQVTRRLLAHEFLQKEILNYTLLEYLLSTENENEKLFILISQLSDESESSWNFIDSFINITSFGSRFIELLASNCDHMWGYIYNNTILTRERKLEYLTLICENVDLEKIIKLNEKDNLLSKFFDENKDIFEYLKVIDVNKMCNILSGIRVLFSNLETNCIDEKVLNYIFDNNLYEINYDMIYKIVQYKRPFLCSSLEKRHYSTVIEISYNPLIEYIHENLTLYIDNVFLREQNVYENIRQIIDLIHRCFFDYERCEKIIQSQKFCLSNISSCCLDYYETEKEQLNLIWDLLLKNNKIEPLWLNVQEYYTKFTLTDVLIEYIEKNSTILKDKSSKCLNNNIREKILISNINSSSLASLLSHLDLNDKNILLSNTKVNEEKMKKLIENHYFEFSMEVLIKVVEQFPRLVVDFILEYQSEFLGVTDYIELKEDTFNNLLSSNLASNEFKNSIIEKYGAKLMTEDIAQDIGLSQGRSFSITKSTFKIIWNLLDISDKEKLMYKYKDLLDAVDFEECFIDLGDKFNQFVDRSKPHQAILSYSDENLELSKRLEEVDYISSMNLKGKNENYYISLRIKER